MKEDETSSSSSSSSTASFVPSCSHLTQTNRQTDRQRAERSDPIRSFLSSMVFAEITTTSTSSRIRPISPSSDCTPSQETLPSLFRPRRSLLIPAKKPQNSEMHAKLPVTLDMSEAKERDELTNGCDGDDYQHHRHQDRYVDPSCERENLSECVACSPCRHVEASEERELAPPAMVSLETFDEPGIIPPAVVSLEASDETEPRQTDRISLEEPGTPPTDMVSDEEPGTPPTAIISPEIFNNPGAPSAMVPLEAIDEVPGTPRTTIASLKSFDNEPGTPVAMVSLEASDEVPGTTLPTMVSEEIFGGSRGILEAFDEEPRTPSAMVSFEAFDDEPGTPPPAMVSLNSSPPSPMAPKKNSTNRIIPLGKQRPRKLSFGEEN